MNQPTASLSSSPPSVHPVTIQTQLQGLTTTSPLLSTTASPSAQTITSHVQQVPVSVLDCHLNDYSLYIQNKCTILHVYVLWNQKYAVCWFVFLRCCYSHSSSRLSLYYWPHWSMTPAWSLLWPLLRPWPPLQPQYKVLHCRWARYFIVTATMEVKYSCNIKLNKRCWLGLNMIFSLLY